MINLPKIMTCGFFQEKSLESGEILFSEGDTDQYLYIVIDGELAVQRSTTTQGEFKTLGLLGIGNIVGEASLRHDDPKEVQIIANRKTDLLYIHGKDEFPKFVTQEPKLAYDMLTTIIDITNTRLHRSNREVTANYEINREISLIETVDTSAVNTLLEKFARVMLADQILYFEKNLVMDEYYKLKYDSMSENKLKNMIIKFPNSEFSKDITDEQEVNISKFFRVTSLKLGQQNYGFIVVGRQWQDFHESEEKLLDNISTSFVGVIHQKEIFDQEKNKNYIKAGI